MPDDSSSQQTATLRRLVYREIRAADRKKFIAKSNISASGGGARDIRFGPYKKFGDVFSRLFPQQRIVKRKADPKTTLFIGTFSWFENGAVQQMESVFEPPTGSRRSEGRITNVHKYPCFAKLPPEDQGMVLLLLIQNADGTVWPVFETEQSLADPGWDRNVADRIVACIHAQRKGKAVAGYMDFENGQEFCNGQ